MHSQKRNSTRDKNDNERSMKKIMFNMNTNLSSLYDENSKRNTTLMELTIRQKNHFQNNIIHLWNLRCCPNNNHIYYDGIRFGKSVFTIKNRKNHTFNLGKTKRNFIMFTANKSECLQLAPNTHCYGTVMTYKPKSDYELSPPMSGVVILMIAVLNDYEKKKGFKSVWDNNIHKLAKECKQNSLNNYDHHGTKGFTYSFGNKPMYGMNDGSSVGLYANKRSKIDRRQNIINEKASMLESMCATALNEGIACVSKYIPEIKHLLCPIINAAYQKQSDANMQLLDKGNTYDDGFWNCFMFVDGKIEDFHTEKDCSYTFITVPQQILHSNLTENEKPKFVFKIDEERELFLPLVNGVSFLYNATFLTHRQTYNAVLKKDEPRFYNISSYSNEKLFNHLRLSFKRMINKK